MQVDIRTAIVNDEVARPQIENRYYSTNENEYSIFPSDWNISREVENAITKGAPAKVTLKVVDSTGRAVPNAQVMLNFTFFERKDSFLEGVTDDQGFFTGQKETMSAYNWSIKKDGYYQTVGRYSFMPHLTNNSIKNGRWQPWNPTIEAILKEKRKPVEMIFKIVETSMPAYGKPIGFDFEVGDWSAPHGKGLCQDVAFEMQDEYIDRSNQGQMFRITFPRANDGVIQLPMDFSSRLPSLYEAPTEGYQKEMISKWHLENGRMTEDSRIKQEDYLIFRFRTYVDENGNVKGARYGKLYGPLEYSFGVAHKRRLYFAYYLNPTIGDRNLEAAGEYP